MTDNPLFAGIYRATAAHPRSVSMDQYSHYGSRLGTWEADRCFCRSSGYAESPFKPTWTPLRFTSTPSTGRQLVQSDSSTRPLTHEPDSHCERSNSYGRWRLSEERLLWDPSRSNRRGEEGGLDGCWGGSDRNPGSSRAKSYGGEGGSDSGVRA